MIKTNKIINKIIKMINKIKINNKTSKIKMINKIYKINKKMI